MNFTPDYRHFSDAMKNAIPVIMSVVFVLLGGCAIQDKTADAPCMKESYREEIKDKDLVAYWPVIDDKIANNIYFVSVSGDNDNPGTKTKPFRTIQQAATQMIPGDTCYIRAGIYRECININKSGSRERPISYQAYPGEKVIIKGIDQIIGKWKQYKDEIYVTKFNTRKEIAQIFIDNQMLFEARYPNATMNTIFDRKTWAEAGKGSVYGKIIDPDLAKTGIDWKGATAVLNVGHQFLTWTRKVKEHGKGSSVLLYPKNLSKQLAHKKFEGSDQWEDDYYYLFGKLEALDSSGEWFYDKKKKLLYIWSPDGKSPEQHSVEIKTRDYGFTGKNLSNIIIKGIHFFGCAFFFNNVEHFIIDNCHYRYPSFAKYLNDPEHKKSDKKYCHIIGNHNVVTNSSFYYSSINGLGMSGEFNRADNNLIYHVNWNGSERYRGLKMNPAKNVFRNELVNCQSTAKNNTIYQVGGEAIAVLGLNNIVEYNHVFNGGLLCEDISLIYTEFFNNAGTVIRNNWVHDCITKDFKSWAKLFGGIGIRSDDQSRNVSFHHNVIWNFGMAGIIAKGDNNLIYNNTIFNIGTREKAGGYIIPTIKAEPVKPWRKKICPHLPAQNKNSKVYNNIAFFITKRDILDFPFKQNLKNNYTKPIDFVDVNNFIFLPKHEDLFKNKGYKDSTIKDISLDIGAYEYGKEYWIPGCRNGINLKVEKLANSLLIKCALKLPIAISVNLDISTNDDEIHTILFTPENWMTFQTVHKMPKTKSINFNALALGGIEIEKINHGINTYWFDRGSTLGFTNDISVYKNQVKLLTNESN